MAAPKDYYKVLGVSETAMVLNRGRVVHYGPSAELLATPDKLTNLIVAQ